METMMQVKKSFAKRGCFPWVSPLKRYCLCSKVSEGFFTSQKSLWASKQPGGSHQVAQDASDVVLARHRGHHLLVQVPHDSRQITFKEATVG